jgi:hypothetical protein
MANLPPLLIEAMVNFPCRQVPLLLPEQFQDVASLAAQPHSQGLTPL